VARKSKIEQRACARAQVSKLTDRALADRVVQCPQSSLKPFTGNERRHPEDQIARLMKSIARVWTNPLLIDEAGTILAGHGRLEAARRLGLHEVPTLTITGLSESEKRAIVIADNALPAQAEWDFELLREHFKNLVEVDFDVELTGFSTGEVDLIIDSETIADKPTTGEILDVEVQDVPVSREGDIWQCGRHSVLCGNSLRPEGFEDLLNGDVADLVVADPPYNVRVDGHATGNGKTRHREFQMASGEMSEEEFTKFLASFIGNAIQFSRNGAIHFIFMDWRHLPELLAAARPQYSDWKNLLVWNKTNAGQGSFYRSKHELIGVFKNGEGRHINNFGLGAKGRYRTNVLNYPSVNSMHPARKGEVALHPTVKPIALIADLIRDCSRRNDLVLDPFGGSGTTLLAAERTGRIARLIELDPLYVDLTVRRWEKASGKPALLVGANEPFQNVTAKRLTKHPLPSLRRTKGV
jgi:DNA modification methylase